MRLNKSEIKVLKVIAGQSNFRTLYNSNGKSNKHCDKAIETLKSKQLIKLPEGASILVLTEKGKKQIQSL